MLVVIGVLLAGVEVFVPGGILGILSALFLIVATVLAYRELGTYGAIGVFGGSLILVIIVVLTELRFLVKSKYGQRLFLTSASSGHVLTENAKEDLDGKTGVTMTVLGPTGVVEIDGKQHEAFSQDGHLQRGDHIEVVRVDNFRVVVKRV